MVSPTIASIWRTLLKYAIVCQNCELPDFLDFGSVIAQSSSGKTTLTASCTSMKTAGKLLITLAAASFCFASQAQSILPGMISTGGSSSFITSDGLLTIKGFSDAASTVPANFTTGGNPPAWFGVEANGALMNADTMKLFMAPGVGFTGFGDIWTRAVISISGFSADPGFAPVGSPAGINSSSYAAGVLTVDLAWNGGTARDYTLSNPAASAGQVLTIALDAATAPQWAVTHLDYAVVPEPGTLSLLALGGLAAALASRRARS